MSDHIVRGRGQGNPARSVALCSVAPDYHETGVVDVYPDADARDPGNGGQPVRENVVVCDLISMAEVQVRYAPLRIVVGAVAEDDVARAAAVQIYPKPIIERLVMADDVIGRRLERNVGDPPDKNPVLKVAVRSVLFDDIGGRTGHLNAIVDDSILGNVLADRVAASALD